MRETWAEKGGLKGVGMGLGVLALGSRVAPGSDLFSLRLFLLLRENGE